MAHGVGWPIPAGGSQSIVDSLAGYLQSLGGKIQTGMEVKSLEEIPLARVILCDVTPRQLVQLAGDRMPSGYRRQLEKYRYGPGVFKVDYALAGSVPWRAHACSSAGTVHIGGTLEEIAAEEKAIWRGEHPDKPYVLFAQQSLFDSSRAPVGKHTAWAYCHVPHGSTVDMAERIEAQIERFAPGFKDEQH
jgi:phytoene dehydrogenase-like protein